MGIDRIAFPPSTSEWLEVKAEFAALRARVAELEKALQWIAAGKSSNPRDYATTAEFALMRASASAGGGQ